MGEMTAKEWKELSKDIAEETSRLIREEKGLCPAFHVSVDAPKWEKIFECPKEIAGHIALHQQRERWVKWIFLGLTALFGSDKLLSLVANGMKIIQH